MKRALGLSDGNRLIRFTDEFVRRYKELSYGQRRLVEDSIRKIGAERDPTIFADHLERPSYFCNWSHRVRANLLLIYRVSKRSITFLSAGTHSQAYHPSDERKS